MGNLQNSQEQNKKEWQTISIVNDSIPGKPSLCRSYKTKLITEEIIIDTPSSSTASQQISIYNKRQSSMSGHLVNIIAFYQLEKIFICSVFKQLFDVKIEYIPWRFQNIDFLSINQALYILKGIFCGCEQLLHHIKAPFFLNQWMVGLNLRGTVKVWINSNYALNVVENPISNQEEEINKEKQMILNIVNMVTKKVLDKEKFQRTLGYELKNCWKLNFGMRKMIIDKHLSQDLSNSVKQQLIKRLSSQKPGTSSQINLKRSSITTIKHDEKPSLSQIKVTPMVKPPLQKQQQQRPQTHQYKSIVLNKNGSQKLLSKESQGKQLKQLKKVSIGDNYRPKSFWSNKKIVNDSGLIIYD